jgi:hypothetical protein
MYTKEKCIIAHEIIRGNKREMKKDKNQRKSA